MDKIKSLDTIESLHKFLFDKENQIHVTINAHGRKYSLGGENFCLNDLINQAWLVSEKSLSKATKSSSEKMSQIVAEIHSLDKQGKDAFKNEKNILYKAITLVRQFFGNLFFNRVETLSNIDSFLMRNQMKFTREENIQNLPKVTLKHEIEADEVFEEDIEEEDEDLDDLSVSDDEEQIDDTLEQLDEILKDEANAVDPSEVEQKEPVLKKNQPIKEDAELIVEEKPPEKPLPQVPQKQVPATPVKKDAQPLKELPKHVEGKPSAGLNVATTEKQEKNIAIKSQEEKAKRQSFNTAALLDMQPPKSVEDFKSLRASLIGQDQKKTPTENDQQKQKPEPTVPTHPLKPAPDEPVHIENNTLQVQPIIQPELPKVTQEPSKEIEKQKKKEKKQNSSVKNLLKGVKSLLNPALNIDTSSSESGSQKRNSTSADALVDNPLPKPGETRKLGKAQSEQQLTIPPYTEVKKSQIEKAAEQKSKALPPVPSKEKTPSSESIVAPVIQEPPKTQNEAAKTQQPNPQPPLVKTQSSERIEKPVGQETPKTQTQQTNPPPPPPLVKTLSSAQIAQKPAEPTVVQQPDQAKKPAVQSKEMDNGSLKGLPKELKGSPNPALNLDPRTSKQKQESFPTKRNSSNTDALVDNVPTQIEDFKALRKSQLEAGEIQKPLSTPANVLKTNSIQPPVQQTDMIPPAPVLPTSSNKGAKKEDSGNKKKADLVAEESKAQLSTDIKLASEYTKDKYDPNSKLEKTLRRQKKKNKNLYGTIRDNVTTSTRANLHEVLILDKDGNPKPQEPANKVKEKQENAEANVNPPPPRAVPQGAPMMRMTAAALQGVTLKKTKQKD